MVLNSKNFGVPQNRERIYIVCWPERDGAPEDFIFPLGLDINDNPIYSKEELAEKTKPTRVGDILEPVVDDKYTISDRLYAGHKRRIIEHRLKGRGFGFSLFNRESKYTNTISARYYKDGSEILIDQPGRNPRKLTPTEAGRLQGYPIGKGFEIPVSDVQAYKQYGNSVSVPVVKTLAQTIKEQLF